MEFFLYVLISGLSKEEYTMKRIIYFFLFFIILVVLGGRLGFSADFDNNPNDKLAPALPKNLHILKSNKAYIGQFILAEQDLEDFIEKTSSTPPIVFFFVDWVNDEDLFADPNNPAPLNPIDEETISFFNKLYDQGSIPAFGWGIPVVFWDIDKDKIHLVPNIPRIINGEFDDYIISTARILKEYGKPIMMTFFGEFNNAGQLHFGAEGFEMPEFEDVDDLVGHYGDPEWPDGPERVRDAFIHIIDIFQKEGADNVSWFMYAHSGYMLKSWSIGDFTDVGDAEWWSHPKYYYPGDEYIDWVGKSVHFTTFAEFKNSFESGYNAWGEVTQRPFFIPEFNFHEGEKSRSKLMKQIFLDYLPTKPRFKAATFYHSPTDVKMNIGFGIPLGGKNDEFLDEIQTWKEVVVQNPAYHSRVVMEQSQ